MNDDEHGLAKQYADQGSVSRSNVLRYSIAMQVIFGTLNGKTIGPMRCNSGGGQVGWEKSVSLANIDPSKKKTSRMRGGALPPGWWIALPEILRKSQRHSGLSWGSAPTDNSIRLVPYKLAKGFEATQRDSFYIHGTGGKGSDGCLIMGPGPRNGLVHAIANAQGAWLHCYLSEEELETQKTVSLTA